MDRMRFNTVVVPAAIKRSLDVLEEKERIYSSGTDRLNNFKTAAIEDGMSIAEALVGMARKHWVSIVQMSKNPHAFSRSEWYEKTVDLRNYSILLEAVLEDMDVK